jgi:hypothetical protein
LRIFSLVSKNLEIRTRPRRRTVRGQAGGALVGGLAHLGDAVIRELDAASRAAAEAGIGPNRIVLTSELALTHGGFATLHGERSGQPDSFRPGR